MSEAAVSARPVERGARAATSQEVLVLDFGGQYSQLIARRVRECGVFSELLPHHVSVDEIKRRSPRGLILSGGPASVYADGAPKLRMELLELGVPVLGICYGMQAMVLELGGRAQGASVGGFWRSTLTALEDSARGLYGIQFHPEGVHTPYGTAILKMFLEDVCGCDMSWSAESVAGEQIRRIREQVGDGRVICGLSGGVDSSVAALLVH